MRDYFTAHLIHSLILGRRNFRYDPMLIVIGDRTSSGDYGMKIYQGQAVCLNGLHSLFPSSRRLHACDSIDEANRTASGSLILLFHLTRCITSRKLSIDQFTLFNYSLSFLISFLVHRFPLFEDTCRKC